MEKELGDMNTQLSANVKIKNKLKIIGLAKSSGKSVSAYLDKLIEGIE